MASLPENATAEDIGDEIIFQHVLLESLDVEADSYAEERQRIEAAIQELQARLEALTGGLQGEPSGPSNGESSPETSLLEIPVHGTRLLFSVLTQLSLLHSCCSQLLHLLALQMPCSVRRFHLLINPQNRGIPWARNAPTTI